MKRLPLYVSLLLIYCLAHRDVVFHLVQLWWGNDLYNYGLLIAPISVWLVRRRWPGTKVQDGPVLGTLALLASLCVGLVGAAGGASIVQHIAFFAGVISLFVLVYGAKAALYHWFALLFLFLAVPFGENILPGLQLITANTTIDILHILGVPISTEGVLIYTPFGNFEVARACAGVRFFLTSLVVGVLLSHLIFKSIWRKALMLTMALLIPIAANIIRVVTIILIARASDIDFAKGVDHIIYGWVFLGIVLALTMAFGYWLADQDMDETMWHRLGGPSRQAYGHTFWALGTLGMILLWGGAVMALTGAQYRPFPAPELIIAPCQNCVARPLSADGNMLFRHLEPDVKASRFRARLADQTIDVARARIDYLPPENTHVIDAFIEPYDGNWSKIPGIGGSIFDESGGEWIARSILKGADRRLMLIQAVKGGTVYHSTTDLKIGLGLARLKRENEPLILTVVAISAVRDWRVAQNTLLSFVNERLLPDRGQMQESGE